MVYSNYNIQQRPIELITYPHVGNSSGFFRDRVITEFRNIVIDVLFRLNNPLIDTTNNTINNFVDIYNIIDNAMNSDLEFNRIYALLNTSDEPRFLDFMPTLFPDLKLPYRSHQ